MKMISIEKELKENSYPGRGIIVGRSEDGKKAAIAYFIMGRSFEQPQPYFCGRRGRHSYTGI